MTRHDVPTVRRSTSFINVGERKSVGRSAEVRADVKSRYQLRGTVFGVRFDPYSL